GSACETTTLFCTVPIQHGGSSSGEMQSSSQWVMQFAEGHIMEPAC
ncbi:MAG: hypothetical protein RIQ66_1331, partial [Pseudomonadota bacterium]